MDTLLPFTRWKLTLEYDGSDFSGWQRQDHALSVQQVLEDAIAKFSGESVRLHVAGRTDAGVHALGQVAHVDLTRAVSADTIRDATNVHVRPHKVAVVRAEQVNADFHARFSALERRYRYQIVNRPAPPVVLDPYAWHVRKPLDLDSMRAAASLLIGQHDFSTFRARHCQSNSPVKTLDELTVTREGALVVLTTRARSFLYHQVRNMVGTLALVGSGQWSRDDFIRAFAACDRTAGGPTAPARGLCFMGVTYPDS